MSVMLQEKRFITSGYADIAGTLVYYETKGVGTPVVLIHGGNLDCRMCDYQMEPFSALYRVIRYDVPGFGKTQPPDIPFSNTGLLNDLLTFFQIEQAVLVGISLGGRISIDFAIEYPDRVSSLILSGPGLSGFQWSTAVEEEFAGYKRALEEGGPNRVVELWLQSPFMVLAMQNQAIRDRVRQLSHENAQAWMRNLPERISASGGIQKLDAIRAPTLILVGDRDVGDIQAIVNLLSAKISGSVKKVIYGAGHLLNMEKPEEFNQLVLTLLESR
jgi:pimeloyl-ACP methyl ester carboxylesterase